MLRICRNLDIIGGGYPMDTGRLHEVLSDYEEFLRQRRIG